MSPGMVMGGESSGANSELVESNLYQKGVKHMYDNGVEQIPGKYIFPADERPTIVTEKTKNMDDDGNDLNLPVIDFAELQGPNRKQALKSLACACESYGFFQLVNHGVAEEMRKSMVDVSKRFFEMPIVEREKLMTADINSPVRYGTSFNQTNDGIFSWRDFLKLICHPLPDVLPHWPSSPHDFRELAVNYAKEMRSLFLKLVEVILESLGLKADNMVQDEDATEESFKDGSQIMVVNCYPPCPQPDLTLGMPPHSDYGFLTLLLQDEVKGLQIQHAGKWVTVQPIPGSFIVNVGDHLEIFSNGRFKSVLHRVIVNPSHGRISVASLHSVPFTTAVRPATELIDEGNPRRYKDTSFANFLDYITTCDSKHKNFLDSRKINLSN